MYVYSHMRKKTNVTWRRRKERTRGEEVRRGGNEWDEVINLEDKDGGESEEEQKTGAASGTVVRSLSSGKSELKQLRIQTSAVEEHI